MRSKNTTYAQILFYYSIHYIHKVYLALSYLDEFESEVFASVVFEEDEGTLIQEDQCVLAFVIGTDGCA